MGAHRSGADGSDEAHQVRPVPPDPARINVSRAAVLNGPVSSAAGSIRHSLASGRAGQARSAVENRAKAHNPNTMSL